MLNRYVRTNVRWETDTHSRFDTHYSAWVDVIDTWSSQKVQTLKGFSTQSGALAVSDAVDKAIVLIRELETKLPTEGQILAAVCACSVAQEQNNAHRDCIAKELGITFAPHVDRYCEPLEEKGLVQVQAPFVRLTAAGIERCHQKEPSNQEQTAPSVKGQSWEL